jgi:hypothetical protein
MKKKLLLAALLVALVAPAAQAAGLNLEGRSAPESITLPSLIPPIKTEGGFLGKSRISLQSNPRLLRINGGYKHGFRTESRFYNGFNNLPDPGNGTKPPCVPEPEGMALAVAAGLLGLAFTHSLRRRRVLGAA